MSNTDLDGACIYRLAAIIDFPLAVSWILSPPYSIGHCWPSSLPSPHEYFSLQNPTPLHWPGRLAPGPPRTTKSAAAWPCSSRASAKDSAQPRPLKNQRSEQTIRPKTVSS